MNASLSQEDINCLNERCNGRKLPLNIKYMMLFDFNYHALASLSYSTSLLH